MIIGLLGFEFESSNKGCEALTYSMMSILGKISDISEIYVFNIHDSLGKIPQLYPNIKFHNVKITIKSIFFWKKYILSLKKCNVVLDITHGDSFSDIYGNKWIFQTNILKTFAININKYLILMPQTYGPFKNKIYKFWTKKIIEKSYRVYTRDRISEDYILNQLKCKNVKPYTTVDLAFTLPYEKNQIVSDKIKIGINVSGLLWNYQKMSNNNIMLNVDYHMYIEKLILWLSSNEKYEIYLVPHVICNDREGEDYYDNDCKVLKNLKQKFKNCIYEDNFETVVDVKNYIASLDILIAARMHASIGAFSSGVCSLPFAYSRKFAGVYNDLDYRYVIDGQKEDTDTALKQTIDLINNYLFIEMVSSKAMEKVMKNANLFIDDLNNTLEKLI